MKSKPEEKKEAQPEVKPQEPKFRYACHGCTNIALLSTSAMAAVLITCQHCGLEQVTKPDNWIAL